MNSGYKTGPCLKNGGGAGGNNSTDKHRDGKGAVRQVRLTSLTWYSTTELFSDDEYPPDYITGKITARTLYRHCCN